MTEIEVEGITYVPKNEVITLLGEIEFKTRTGAGKLMEVGGSVFRFRGEKLHVNSDVDSSFAIDG
ncbi:hypothetical protein [Rhodococcus wratislaviensis]|uniref:hypothetical protein n=1 Tax=Rhodococcus wratislaviensis TaxID=44752 RepID=UPI0011C04E11|nr:hypothetical protein [Rhodococcus wratislaviensis]